MDANWNTSKQWENRECEKKMTDSICPFSPGIRTVNETYNFTDGIRWRRGQTKKRPCTTEACQCVNEHLGARAQTNKPARAHSKNSEQEKEKLPRKKVSGCSHDVSFSAFAVVDDFRTSSFFLFFGPCTTFVSAYKREHRLLLVIQTGETGASGPWRSKQLLAPTQQQQQQTQKTTSRAMSEQQGRTLTTYATGMGKLAEFLDGGHCNKADGERPADDRGSLPPFLAAASGASTVAAEYPPDVPGFRPHRTARHHI